MYGKVEMGHSGVEVTEDGINLITQRCPLTNNDGYNIEEQTNPYEISKDQGCMLKFLEVVLVGSYHIMPIDAGYLGELKDVKFLVNEQYILHVVVDTKENIYPMLVREGDVNGEIHAIKFTYSGEAMDSFFNNVLDYVEDIFDGKEM